MNFEEIILFGNKSYSELLKDIYSNSIDKSKRIDGFLDQLKLLIKTSNDAAILIPLVKEYLDVSVKNDEQLVKMAGVVQRFFSSKITNADEGGSSLLTEEEKTNLLKEAKEIMHDAKLDTKINKLEEKSSEVIKQ